MASAAPPATPPAANGPASGPLTQSEMYRNYNFLLRIDSTEVKCTELLALGVRIAPVLYRESGPRAVCGGSGGFSVRRAGPRDPERAPGLDGIVPAGMAGLGERSPGARGRWLGFVARRAGIGEPAEPHAPRPTEPREPVESQLPQS